MFQKFNTSEFLREQLKTSSFEESLKILFNRSRNAFLRFIKESYEDFKEDYNKILNKIGQEDLKYVSLYISGKFHKCPECGKYSKHICCSKECSKKHNYNLKLFNELLEKNDFETSLRLLHQKVGANRFTADVNRFYPIFKSQFDELLEKIGSNDTRFISLYIEDKLTKCKACGKTIVKPRVYCSSKCFGKDFDYSSVPKDYKAIGQKISKSLLSRTEEQVQDQIEKIRKTKLERYGNPGFTNPEKSKQTCLEKYGVSSYCKTNEFKKRLTNAAIQKYKHPEDFNKEYIETHFIDEKGFLMVQECSEHFGIDRTTSYFRVKLLGVDFKYRTGRSDAEETLFKWIPVENKIHNTRKIIYPKELDIFLPDYNLGIEYNGVYWHSFYEPDYHQEKTLMCIEKGIKLFQIFETDNLEIWKSMILNALGKNEKIFARKCIIKHLESKETMEFLNENHLQGSCGSSIRLGLFYNDKLVQVMTFGKPRFSKKYDFELLRFCTLRGYNVVGGASKLFKFFKDNYKGSVVSYCNLRYSNGDLYKKLGFTQVSLNKPSYFYVKNYEVLTRYQCQKHKLKNLLESFDPSLTESENMQNNGYLKIYDAGSLTFSINCGVNSFESVISSSAD